MSRVNADVFRIRLWREHGRFDLFVVRVQNGFDLRNCVVRYACGLCDFISCLRSLCRILLCRILHNRIYRLPLLDFLGLRLDYRLELQGDLDEHRVGHVSPAELPLYHEQFDGITILERHLANLGSLVFIAVKHVTPNAMTVVAIDHDAVIEPHDDGKEATAKSLYAYGCSYEDIADTLSVGKKRVSEWLSRVVKDNKEKRDRKIFDMWLACYTQQEIADACDCPQKTVDDQIKTFSETVLGNQSAKSLADHATDFDPPLYNIWKQQTKSEGSSHFGNSETRWVDVRSVKNPARLTAL